MLRPAAIPPALVTDLQRLDSRLSAAARRLKSANEELHLAEVDHRLASEAVEAELARLAGEDAEHLCPAGGGDCEWVRAREKYGEDADGNRGVWIVYEFCRKCHTRRDEQ